MRTFKRVLAAVISLAMMLSLISIMPAMAETEEVLDKFEEIRKETNLISNPGLEDADISETVIEGEGEEAVEKVVTYYSERFRSGATEFERSSKESYNGDYSILSKKRAGGGDYTIAWATAIRKDATYIASVMALGTVANKTHWDASAGKNETWGSKFILTPAANDYQGANNQSGITPAANVQNENVSKIDYTMTAAASSDTEAEKASKDDWKRFHTTFTVDSAYPDVAAVGVGMNIQFQGTGLTTEEQKYLELYTDDYYLAELMVADIECTTPETINVPAAGTVTVDLEAIAYNQLGNTTGLEDSEFVWEIPATTAGAYVNGNQLIVSDAAKEGSLKVNVTCVPKFKGAETQDEKYTKYRSETFTFNVEKTSEADYFENIRKSTNKLVAEKAGVENDTLWETYDYATANWQRAQTYEISTNQAYNGEQSLLTKRPENGYINESHFPHTGVTKNKAMVASAMVLGTQANEAACEEDPEAGLSMRMGFYNTSYFNLIPYTKKIDEVDVVFGESSGNKVLLNTMLDVDAAEKASKDKWQMVHAYCVYPDDSRMPTMYYTGAGVMATGKNIEFYSDDYYFGELIVAAVKGTAPHEVFISDEETTIELTAEAYNQLGTTDYFGENTTYTWDAVALPDGVELQDNVLTISPEAKAGKAVISVTVDPEFEGADAQTDEQKAGRTNTIMIDINDVLGFEFDETDDSVTASAYIVNTTADDINANVFSVLYEINGTAKKAVAVSARELSAPATSGEAEKVSVDFDTFEFEAGKTYQISCFMWNVEENRYKPMISSVSINR